MVDPVHFTYEASTNSSVNFFSFQSHSRTHVQLRCLTVKKPMQVSSNFDSCQSSANIERRRQPTVYKAVLDDQVIK